MNNMKAKLGILAALSVALIVTFMVIQSGGNWDYVLPKRGVKIAAIVLTGGSIALSTMVFQTITNNRILTPSILGLDSLYLLMQTFVVFAFGASTLTMMSKHSHFLLSIGLMVLFSGVLYKLVFKREGRNIYFFAADRHYFRHAVYELHLLHASADRPERVHDRAGPHVRQL